MEKILIFTLIGIVCFVLGASIASKHSEFFIQGLTAAGTLSLASVTALAFFRNSKMAKDRFHEAVLISIDNDGTFEIRNNWHKKIRVTDARQHLVTITPTKGLAGWMQGKHLSFNEKFESNSKVYHRNKSRLDGRFFTKSSEKVPKSRIRSRVMDNDVEVAPGEKIFMDRSHTHQLPLGSECALGYVCYSLVKYCNSDDSMQKEILLKHRYSLYIDPRERWIKIG